MKHRWIAWLIIVIGMVVCRAAFLEDVVYNIDEAEYAVAAHGLAHGWLPGVDLLGTTKPPGITVLYYLLFGIFGHSLAAIHVAQTLTMIAAGIAVVELAIALWGLGAAVPAAFLWWVLCNSYGLPPEMFSLNVESPGLVFLLPALLLAWKRSDQRWAMFVAGLCLALATLFRQSYAVFAIPLAVTEMMPGKRRVETTIYSAAGFVVPWIMTGVAYASSRGLGWAWDSWVRYPISYAGDLGLVGFLEAFEINGAEFLRQAIVPLALAACGAAIVWRERPSARGRFLYAMLIASVLALCAGSRFWGHYWLQTYPVITLLGAGACVWLTERYSNWRVVAGIAIVLAGLISAARLPTWRSWDPDAPPRGVAYARLDHEGTDLDLGAYARENTLPDEKIVVWGYCPQIYHYADRLPGVRDYLCHYITGYSPGSFDPFSQRAVRPYGHPRAQQMFIDDLEKRRPKYIFDLVQIDDYAFTFLNYSLRSYKDLAEYLRANYLPEGQVGRALVYRRRTPEDTWTPDQDQPE